MVCGGLVGESVVGGFNKTRLHQGRTSINSAGAIITNETKFKHLVDPIFFCVEDQGEVI